MNRSPRFDPLAPDVLPDPYRVYDRMRRGSPVLWDERLRSWLVTSYAECARVLSEVETFGSDPSRIGLDTATIHRSIQSADPPAHGRFRRTAQRALHPSTVARELIEQRVAALLGAVGTRGTFDVIHDFAMPLAFQVMTVTLGVRPPDYATFVAWSQAIADSMDFGLRPETEEPGRIARAAMNEYLEVELQRLRDDRSGGMLGILVGESSLEVQELINTARVIVDSSFDVIVRLIGNGVHALTMNASEIRRLTNNPNLWRLAVEEFIRFDSPVQAIGRLTVQDTTLASVALKRGDVVIALIGAAHRDPLCFAEPGRFDAGRSPNPHLAFGRGIHACLGAWLARLEVEIAARRLVERYPDMRVVTAERRMNATVRGFERLTVSLT